jgi:hypothetical protein
LTVGTGTCRVSQNANIQTLKRRRKITNSRNHDDWAARALDICVGIYKYHMASW